MPKKTKPKPGGKGEEGRANERRVRAFTLYKAGLSLRQIAKQIGVSHVAVHAYIKTALKELHEEQRELIEHIRDLELRRLDDMIRSIWPKVIAGDLNAIDRVLSIQGRRAKYLALDSPDKHEHTVTLEQLIAGSNEVKDE